MKKLAMILCVLFIPAISSAAPSIINVSGNFNHGNNITITGDGFGTKSPANPLVWADFENLNIGDEAAENGIYSISTLVPQGATGFRLTTTSADLPHARSKKSVRAIVYDGQKRSVNVSTYVGGTKIYTFAKKKYAHQEYWNKLVNYKMWRNYSLPENGYIDSVLNYHNFSNPFVYPGGSSSGMKFLQSWGKSSGSLTSFKHPSNNVWGTEEVQTSKSTLDVQDGTFKFWYNSKLYHDLSIMNRSTNYPGDYSRAFIEDFYTPVSTNNGEDHPPLNAYVYYDDVYIDSTWARVMIGNASTFAACTHREPLIPTAWSSSSITAYFNQGSFSNGQSVYVFVVDSNGNASLGKAITIGGVAESNTQPITSSPIPNPPAKLNIN